MIKVPSTNNKYADKLARDAAKAADRMEAAKAPDHLFFITREELSDKSCVYNIKYGEITIHAVDKHEARQLAHKLAEAIDEHSVDTSGVIDETA